MKVTALIVDDEPVARAGLRRLLNGVDWVELVGEAAAGTTAVTMIDQLRPELVFLDVQMPGLNGIDVLRAVSHQPYVVFTTAYAEHAVTAFELGAIDYLLKPFGGERFTAALERVRACIGEPLAHSPLERLGAAIGHGPISRLFVRSGVSLIPLGVQSVHWFRADGDYVIAHTEHTRHTLHLALARLEARLDGHRFVRIHRATIVNLDHVKRFRRVGSAQLVAEMNDGTRLPVSRTRAQELRLLGS